MLPTLSSFLRSSSSSSPPSATSIPTAASSLSSLSISQNGASSTSSSLTSSSAVTGNLTQAMYARRRYPQIRPDPVGVHHRAPRMLAPTMGNHSEQPQEQRLLLSRKRKPSSLHSAADPSRQHREDEYERHPQYHHPSIHLSDSYIRPSPPQVLSPPSSTSSMGSTYSRVYDRNELQHRRQEDSSDGSNQWMLTRPSPSHDFKSERQSEEASVDTTTKPFGGSRDPVDPTPPVVQRERTSRYLSEGDRRTIISRIERGEKQVSLAKEYSVSRAAICNLYKNRKEVLTRVDRDPDAKHPKKQKPKKPAASLSPAADFPATSMSPPTSPVEAEEEDELLEEEQGYMDHPARGTEHLSGPMETELAGESPLSHPSQRRVTRPFAVHEATAYSLPIKNLLSTLRNEDTQSPTFRHVADRLMRLLVEEALTCLPHQDVDTMTPYGDPCPGIVPTDERDICAVTMEGNGSVLLRAFAEVLPLASTGAITLSQEHGRSASSPSTGSSYRRWQIHAQLPAIDPRQVVLLLDLFCGTGERACSVLSCLVHEKRIAPSSIYFITVNGSLSGLQRVHHYFPGTLLFLFTVQSPSSDPFSFMLTFLSFGCIFADVALITAQMDKGVDEHHRIRPGIAHFLERYWNHQPTGSSHSVRELHRQEAHTSQQQQQQHRPALQQRYLHHNNSSPPLRK